MENTKRDSVLATLGLIESVRKAKPSKKIQQCISKAYYDALYDTYKSIFKHQLAHTFATTGDLPYQANDPIMQDTIERARDRVVSKPRTVFLTVNPKPGIKFTEISSRIEGYVKKKIVSNAQWVFEIRKAPDNGLHCHILLTYTGRPYDFKTATKKYFASICDSKNPKILCFRYVEDSDVNSKKEYMSGIKQDKKLPGVKATLTWRKKNKIEELYSTPQETEVSLVGVRTKDEEIIVD